LRNYVESNIRFYQPGDEDQIVDLLKRTFPKWAAFNDPLGLWKWKYIDSPQKSIIVVAINDNKIVGCNHSLIYHVKLGSKISSVGYSDDLAVETDYRGQKIWKKMNQKNLKR
jgi:hypothetical protein